MYDELEKMISGNLPPIISPPEEVNLVEEPEAKELSPFEGVIVANQLIISHAMSMSAEHRKWAQVAANNLETLDKAFESAFDNTGKRVSINRKEMAAAWYAIENVNANNKRLRHSVEEAKVQQALIGTDLHVRTNLSAQKKKHVLQFLALSDNNKLED